MSIHPTAIVDSQARIGRDVEIGAFCVVGADVTLGDRCKVHHHVTIEGDTTIGEACEIFPQAVIGMRPQDIKYAGERTQLDIGSGNTFREMVTVHPGTANGGGITRIGDGNLILIGAHVAHDCHIGSGCIIANYVQFAGHVRVEDNVNVGGHSAVHHFVTVGKHAFIGGMTRVAADVPPFMVVVAARGTRSEIRMVNGVGLERGGYSHENISALKMAFMKLFSRRARMDGKAIRDRVQEILHTEPLNPHVKYLCEFLMRSFDYGRHGRYLESLRGDKVHRSSWKPGAEFKLTVDVVGCGSVDELRSPNSQAAHDVFRLTASAERGWEFAGWNGCLSGRRNPARIVLDGDKTVTATFTQCSTT
ncbi:MAG: acyl-ACP--UDP-N-acetylglucosamine O-acyltransferase [Planctomycetes bacterium]|nr:acyl-ACP--UDP-N-acetylglucosamine O-acyltransferase [Planctomycetota bacterium]